MSVERWRRRVGKGRTIASAGWLGGGRFGWIPRILGAARRCARLAVLVPICAAALPCGEALAFQVQGVFQIGPAHVGVAFSDSVNVTEAVRLSNYTITPRGGASAVRFQAAVLQNNQRMVFLIARVPLPRSATYDVAVSGVTSRSGAPLDPGGPASFTTVAEPVIGIAEVQENVSTLRGRTVTVIGQVTIGASSSSGTPSGYIQDGTGRGINLFGNPPRPPADTVGNVVKATGNVEISQTTVQLTPFTAATIAAGMPPPAPQALSVAEAKASRWEGTYIRTTATLTAPPEVFTSTSHLYRAADGGDPFLFRVRNSTGVNHNDFTTNDVVTGAGAGVPLQAAFQMVVGRPLDLVRGPGAPETTPPSLVSASGQGDGNTVRLAFSEPLGTGAATASNYVVYPTAAPGSPLAVTSASASVSTVTLTLGGPLVAGVEYTVEVSNVRDVAGNSIAPGSAIVFVTSVPGGFRVTGAFQFGAGRVGVGFSDRVNAAQAAEPSRYGLTPAVAVTAVRLQENGRTAVLETASALPTTTSFSVTVTGVTSEDGATLASVGPFAFTTAGETVVDIATIQENSATWNGQSVTVIGQTYIPVGSRGGTPSGYVQDGSGRGIHLFGGSIQAAVDQLGSVAKVTGTVGVSSSGVEITGYSASQVVGGQPRLGARTLTVPEANSSQWEGTYIETTAEITDIQPFGADDYDYSATGDGADIVFRVGNGLGIAPGGFAAGEVVTGRGAGRGLVAPFRIDVGNADDFFETAGDLTPPALVSARGEGGSNTVKLEFSEPVGSGGTTTSNYLVYRTAAPGSPIAVTSASVSDSTVTLGLGTALVTGVGYTVEVSNVEDLAGNPIAPGSRATFTATTPGGFRVTGVFQFGASYVGVGFSGKVNASQAVVSSNYAFTPALSINRVTIQENGQTAILRTSSPLPAGASYSVTVSGITSQAGEALVGSGPFTLATATETVVDIASIQENAVALDGQRVTVIGQTYIPVGSRGGTPSGYIQDGSGRGINVFGGSAQAAVNQLGSVAKVTGTVDIFFTTVEIVNYSAVQVAAGQPHLGARVLTVPQANSSQWEGTYIETSALITNIQASGANNFNYDATASGANITFRVGNALGIQPGDFAIGDRVTGRGAGGAFQATFQINVGNAVDFFESIGGPEPIPPPAGAALRAVGGGPFPPVTLVRNMVGRGEVFEFQISGPHNSDATCRIFDVQGRLMKVLFDGRLSGTAERALSWDARDEAFEFVPAGLYICHLETVGLDGNRDEDRAPIVVAVRLK